MNRLHFRTLPLLLVFIAGCIADLSVPAPEPETSCDPTGFSALAEAFPPCDLGLCGASEDERARGRCVDANQIPQGQRDLLAPCASGDSVCVPLDILLANGRFAPTSCRSLAGVEGRCLSTCIPDVHDQEDILPVDVCVDGERCAPCYDPTTGQSSGACETNACDAPVEPAPDFCALDYDAHPLLTPSTFEACPSEVCGAEAHCLPNDLVPDGQRELLADCDASRKCVPDAILVSGGNRPAPGCRSFRGEAEGRCLSTCIPSVGAQADRIPQSTCEDDERCAPCFDPVSGESTGACEGTCDAPVDAPYLFVDCCSGRAECVPSSSVPADKRSNLAQDSCPNSDDLCVPRELTNPTFVPEACHHDLGLGLGACISTCIASANTIGDADGECPTDTKCVPCSIAGTPTGACDW